MPNYGHLSLSCTKIERPSPLEKPSCKVRLFVQNRSRKYRPKVTVTTLFQTAFHPNFQPLSQTAHVRSHSRKRVHTRLSEKDRTQRLTRQSRGLPFLDTAGLCVTSEISLITAFVTIDSTVLLYTYISQFSVAPHYQQQLYLRPSLVVFFNFSLKRPTFAFTPESGLHTRLSEKNRTQGHTRRNRGVLDGGGITTLGPFCADRKPCVARG